MATYRVGNHQPQNLYRDDTYIGVMFTAEDAALVVEALNDAHDDPEDGPCVGLCAGCSNSCHLFRRHDATCVAGNRCSVCREAMQAARNRAAQP